MLGTINILETFKEIRPDGRILVVSTGLVYASSGAGKALDEAAPLRPANMYAISKAAADLAALGYAESFGMPVITARPNNHTGPGQSERFVVPGLISRVKAIAGGHSAPVLQVGNMDSERDFCDVRDVARAYRLLIESGQAGLAYNIASCNRVSIREILDDICRLAGVSVETHIDPDRYRPTDYSPLLDTSRIAGDVSWHPEIERAQTLRDMLQA